MNARYQNGSISEIPSAYGDRWRIRFSEWENGKRPATIPRNTEVRVDLLRRGEQLLDVHTGCMQFHCVYAPRCPAETHLSRWVEPCSPPIESFLCP